MKISFQTLVKTLVICMFAWIANVSAGNVQYKLEEFYDESASLQLEQVSNLNFSPTSGQIRKPYQKGTCCRQRQIDHTYRFRLTRSSVPKLAKRLGFSASRMVIDFRHTWSNLRRRQQASSKTSNFIQKF